MINYKLLIQYDGTDYAGWQIQDNAKSVQGTITEAIKTILKADMSLIGSGRTDAGVHALGQVANFRYENDIDIYRFNHSMNSLLPNDISILKIEKVDEKFHSRFDAVDRTYIYLISKIKSPFYYKYSHYKKNLDIGSLNKLSSALSGEKDFTSFCRKNSDVKDKICNIRSLHWKEYKNFYVFSVSADRFLHGMVRTIIGTLFRICDTENGIEELINIINAKDREAAGEAVEAKGLFLYKIKY